MQQRVWEELGCRLDVGGDQLVVALTPDAAVAVADIHGVVEQRLAIGAHVQAHRDHPIRIDSRRRRVHAELPNRDRKSVHAPVADPEDRLGIGRHQQVDVFGAETKVAQRRLDVVDVVDREVDAVGSLVLVAVALDRLGYHRGVDDRQHLLQVIAQQLVVEDLVAVAERREKLVLGQIRRLRAVLLIRTPSLLLERQHARG